MQSPNTGQGGALTWRTPPTSQAAFGHDSQNTQANWHFKPNMAGMPLAKFLGWFSIGLGIAQLLAPRQMARVTGVKNGAAVMRAIGAREIASGAGILSRKQPSTWLWSRVAGDAMDLALLGLAASGPNARRNRVALAAAAVAGVTVLDLLSSVQQTRRERKQGPVEESNELYVETAIAINKTPRECYDFWRNFENLPRFMEHLEAVKVHDDKRSHWVARGPAGSSIEWDAEVTADQPGELLAWHSSPGADVENAGTVRFERGPGERGSIVRVEIQYRPPAGVAGALVASLFNEEPSQQVADDLRRFKWLLETGVIPTTVGQSAGPRSVIGRLFRKGQPG
ncbi:MAG: hypothetical protein JWP36_2847 [Paucimonas sp.]|jgi:uncharacterized membrane protein|nr:hypothetical protein [Paucimonas sp.]